MMNSPIFKMGRRSKAEILLDILKMSKTPIRPTRLMYATNLSWKPLQGFLEKLIKIGYLEEITVPTNSSIKNERYLLVTTDKGKMFVNSMEMFDSDLNFSTAVPKDYDIKP